MDLQATLSDDNAFLANFLPALSRLPQVEQERRPEESTNNQSSIEKMKAVNTLLDRKVEELKEQQKKPLKSRLFAYGSTILFSSTSIGAYQAVIDTGSTSEDKNFRLVSVVMLVMLSLATLGSWQFFCDKTEEREKDNLSLHENKRYRQFTGAVLAYSKNPNETLREKMVQLYEQLPQSTQSLLQEPMKLLEKPNQLSRNVMTEHSQARKDVAIDVETVEDKH